MTDFVCPLCAGRDYVPLPRETVALLLPPLCGVARCRRCGFVLQYPRVDAADLYASREYYEQFDYDAQVDTIRKKHFAARLERIAARLGRVGKILDVGCATGEFLQLARERGWETFGLDVSPYAIAEARRRYELDVQVSALTDATLAPESFDVVHMNHVLEHLPDPNAALAAAHGVLRAGGWLVAEVPYEFYNAAETWRRIFRRAVKRATPGVYHLSFFSPRTLARVMRQNGFAPEISTYSDMSERFTPRLYLNPFRWLWVALGDALGRGSNIVAFARKVSANFR